MAMKERESFVVKGMSCQHCVRTIKQNIGKLPGVSKVDVDLATGIVTVFYDGTQVDKESIEGAITSAGYEIGK